MHTLPQLYEEDLTVLNEALDNLLAKTEATTVVLTDRAGFRITERGDLDLFDTTTLAALASGSFLANQEIAKIIGEDDFNSCYQQGARTSLFVCSVGVTAVLMAIFPPSVSAGLVKHYALQATFGLARQLQSAHERAPGAGLDLSILNVADSPQFFRRKDTEPALTLPVKGK